MIRTLHQISTYLLTALGVIHTSLTPIIHKEFSVDAMYFASAGLAMIVIGFLNTAISRQAGKDRRTEIQCYIANILFTAFGVLTVLALREPQAYFGLLLIIIMTVTAFMLPRRGIKE